MMHLYPLPLPLSCFLFSEGLLVGPFKLLILRWQKKKKTCLFIYLFIYFSVIWTMMQTPPFILKKLGSQKHFFKKTIVSTVFFFLFLKNFNCTIFLKKSTLKRSIYIFLLINVFFKKINKIIKFEKNLNNMVYTCSD